MFSYVTLISEAASDPVRKFGQQVQSTPFLLSQHWVTGTNHEAQLFNVSAGNVNPGPHACKANTLVIEPFPWAPFLKSLLKIPI